MGTKELLERNRQSTTVLPKTGGGKRDRTADLLHAMQALSQLSYTPGKMKANYTEPSRLSQFKTNLKQWG